MNKRKLLQPIILGEIDEWTQRYLTPRAPSETSSTRSNATRNAEGDTTSSSGPRTSSPTIPTAASNPDERISTLRAYIPELPSWCSERSTVQLSHAETNDLPHDSSLRESPTEGNGVVDNTHTGGGDDVSGLSRENVVQATSATDVLECLSSPSSSKSKGKNPISAEDPCDVLEGIDCNPDFDFSLLTSSIPQNTPSSDPPPAVVNPSSINNLPLTASQPCIPATKLTSQLITQHLSTSTTLLYRLSSQLSSLRDHPPPRSSDNTESQSKGGLDQAMETLLDVQRYVGRVQYWNDLRNFDDSFTYSQVAFGANGVEGVFGGDDNTTTDNMDHGSGITDDTTPNRDTNVNTIIDLTHDQGTNDKRNSLHFTFNVDLTNPQSSCNRDIHVPAEPIPLSSPRTASILTFPSLEDCINQCHSDLTALDGYSDHSRAHITSELPLQPAVENTAGRKRRKTKEDKYVNTDNASGKTRTRTRGRPKKSVGSAMTDE